MCFLQLHLKLLWSAMTGGLNTNSPLRNVRTSWLGGWTAGTFLNTILSFCSVPLYSTNRFPSTYLLFPIDNLEGGLLLDPLNRLNFYPFPLFTHICQVLNWALISFSLRMNLVFPCWPQQDWHRGLLSLLVEMLKKFPQWCNQIMQSHVW